MISTINKLCVSAFIPLFARSTCDLFMHEKYSNLASWVARLFAALLNYANELFGKFFLIAVNVLSSNPIFRQ
jgi:hypothetical protein